MSVDLRCPNCEDNLGKDVENSVIAFCGTCGEEFYNERGDTDDLTEYEEEKLVEYKRQERKRRSGRIIGGRF
jgi:hypothetical protein